MLLRFRSITLGAAALLACSAQAASPAPDVFHAVRFDVSRPMRHNEISAQRGSENEVDHPNIIK
jgi:hypothetical protein